MDGVTIRPAAIGDAEAIARLDIETWRTSYAGILGDAYLVGLRPARRAAGWAHAIGRQPGDVKIAMDSGGELVGFGSCGDRREPPDYRGEVFTLYVAPDRQDQGIGRALLIALFERLAETGRASALIWVLRENPARFFYERLGGKQVSRKSVPVGGKVVPAIAYGWRDLPAYLSALPRAGEDRAG